jgi:DNA-binding response OmpR family regulator
MQKPRILLIDDSELILEGLKLHLGSKFDVVTVSDPTTALMELRETRFDLILTDLIMPAINGISLISSLRQQHPGTPIIAMTGWGKPPQEYDLKADTVLLKPFDLDELDQTIGSLLISKPV